MSDGPPFKTTLLIIGILVASGIGYVFGQIPITGLNEEINRVEMDNIALQSQVTEVMDENDALITKLEVVLGNLSKVQLDYQVSYDSYKNEQEKLENTLLSLEEVLSSFHELKDDFIDIKENNSHLLGLYSSVWEKYADLIVAYNNLTSGEPVGEMVVTAISGIVNGDWENGNEGWLTQGVSNLVGGVKYLHKNDLGTFTTQSVTLTHKNQGLRFRIKPQPFGGVISFEISVKGVELCVEQYSGVNADWEEIIIPFRPLIQMREQYGFPIEDTYDIRFTVLAGENTGANVALDDITLLEIGYQPEETPLSSIEYIRNGDFDDPIIFDPDFNIPYWYEPGSGGSIAFSSSSGRTGRAICPHPGKIIQELNLPATEATLTFWILPQPNDDYSTINVFFDEELIFEETYGGSNEDYDWIQITLNMDISQGTHYLTFEVLTDNAVRIDDVSLVG
ncbi:hypothetical protein ISS40_05465 [Candidatus Bathyarchaeota archaeon]|nr:hypothetical protein [Candidatus Bathyarchaeota archaeon]